MRWLPYTVIALLVLVAPAGAADRNERSSVGTLARPAVTARPAKLAEIAKDATPPEPGRKRGGASDYKRSERAESYPRFRFR